MRKALIAGLSVALAAPLGVRAQEAPPPLAAGDIEPASPSEQAAPLDAEPPPGPQPGDPAPAPASPPAPGKARKKADVAETAGGAVGGLLAKGVGTAVAGPVGGIAAGFVGNRVGKGAVGLVKRVIGVGDEDDHARTASDAGRDVAANAPEPVGLSEFTPAPVATAEPTPAPADDEPPAEPHQARSDL